MSALFLWTISILYLGAFIGFLIKGQIPAAVMTLCYAIANVAYTYVTK